MRARWDDMIADLDKRHAGKPVNAEVVADVAADVVDFLSRKRDIVPGSVLANWFDLDDAQRTTGRLRAMIREYWLAEDARLTLEGSGEARRR